MAVAARECSRYGDLPRQNGQGFVQNNGPFRRYGGYFKFYCFK